MDGVSNVRVAGNREALLARNSYVCNNTVFSEILEF